MATSTLASFLELLSGSLVFDDDLSSVEWNQAIESVTGFTESELMGR